MKHSILTASILVAFSFFALAGVPDEPEKEKPPVVEKASPETRTQAETAIQKGIVDIFRAANDRVRASYFSRSRPLKIDFSVTFIESAPGGITVSAVRLPFDVRRAPQHPAIPVSTAVSGYYDVKTQSVQVYEETTKTYVAAANHPLVKAMAAKSQPQPQAPAQAKPR